MRYLDIIEHAMLAPDFAKWFQGSQVVDAKLTRPNEGARRGSDLTSFYQRFDVWQLAMRGAFFHALF